MFKLAKWMICNDHRQVVENVFLVRLSALGIIVGHAVSASWNITVTSAVEGEVQHMALVTQLWSEEPPSV